MHIRTLRLQNFRSHVDTILTLAPLTVIRGTNAAGKSSVEQALEIILASRADGTTADGKGSAALIRASLPKASIDIELDHDGATILVKGALTDGRRAVVATNPADPQWAGASDFLDGLTADHQVLSCLLNNRRFVDLNPDEQRTVIAAIILPQTYSWPEWVIPATASIEAPINWARTPFEIIAQAHDLAFKARTNVNRDLKNFRLPEGDTAEAANYEDYKARLSAVVAELETAVTTLVGRRSSEEATQSTRQSAHTRLTEATQRLDREERVIPGIEEKILSPTKVKELEKVAKNKAQAAAIEIELGLHDAALALTREQFKQLNDLTHQPNCPTCQSPITSELAAALAKPILTEQTRLTELRTAAIDARKKLGNPNEAETQILAHRQAAKDLEASQRRAAEERVIVQDAQSKLDELGPVPTTDYTAEETAIAELRARVQKGTVAVAGARSAVDLTERIATAKTQQAALQKRQQELEKLVEYFGDGPKGVKFALVAEKAGPFLEGMNRVLAAWGYTCTVNPETLQFFLLFNLDSVLGATPISIRHLSKSQRYRFAAAFQVALAIFSGYRFVCLDEADIYDADGRAGLYESLQAHLASGELEQAILLSTDERENVPNVPNAVFYRFDDIAEAGHIATTQVRQLKPVAQQAA